jgi:hypothetical protein
MEIPAPSSCVFKLYTRLWGPGGRQIYVDDDTDATYHTSVSRSFWTAGSQRKTTGLLDLPVTSPVINAAAVAGRHLYREHNGTSPPGWLLYVLVSDQYCDGTYFNPYGQDQSGNPFAPGPGVCIHTNFYGVDHSQYKFVIGHELGHHQASQMGGPRQQPVSGLGAQ